MIPNYSNSEKKSRAPNRPAVAVMPTPCAACYGTGRSLFEVGYCTDCEGRGIVLITQEQSQLDFCI